MIKILFYLSIIVSFACFGGIYYFNSFAYQIAHPQFFTGFSQSLTLVGILASLMIGWGIYAIFTRSPFYGWLPLAIFIVSGIVVLLRVYSII